jgi:hypothetical protein
MPDVPAKVDLRALIQDRKAKDARPTVKHPMCLDPDLLDELNELKAKKAARDKALADGDGDPDVRMGKVDPLKKQIEELEKAVAERSLVAVFRTPTRARMAELTEMAKDDADIDPIVASECFWHFLRDGQIDPTLTKEDFEDLLSLMPTGEVNTIGGKVYSRAAGRPDFPESVRQLHTTHK